MRKSKKNDGAGALQVAPEASEAHKKAVASARDFAANRPARAEPVISVDDGSVKITAANGDDQGQAYLMFEAFGTGSNPFVGNQLRHLISATGQPGKLATSEELGAGLAFVAAIEPQNELEAALAVQMWASHSLALEMTAKAKNATILPQMVAFGNLAAKSQRTMVAQIEALTKLRTGGKQVVEHRHVYIDNRGGQAVIAENLTGGRGTENNGSQSHAFGAAMLGAHPERNPMPITLREEQETLSDARS